MRSGVIQSVHAFASDPNRGTFLLVISLLMVVPALFLFMVRAPKFESAKQISGIEDISLVLAVLLLAVTAVCVLFGTLYPLVHEALGERISFCRCAVLQFNSLHPWPDFGSADDGSCPDEKFSDVDLGCRFLRFCSGCNLFRVFHGSKIFCLHNSRCV